MSDAQAQQEPKLSLLDQFKLQREQFVQQSAQVQVQFQQLQGAIFACDQMIQKIAGEAVEHLKDLAEKVQAPVGEEPSGETNNEAAEQSPQE